MIRTLEPFKLDKKILEYAKIKYSTMPGSHTHFVSGKSNKYSKLSQEESVKQHSPNEVTAFDLLVEGCPHVNSLKHPTCAIHEVAMVSSSSCVHPWSVETNLISYDFTRQLHSPCPQVRY